MGQARLVSISAPACSTAPASMLNAICEQLWQAHDIQLDPATHHITILVVYLVSPLHAKCSKAAVQVTA